ncbi:non-canonical purine NTP pyrophosphatase [Rhizobium calliandrae]|uniref:non-canonical purine NTP pyrophosphatase n=1 Tax=Rhizobium calliandrae TaxID=1312182 RepID=UPI003D80A874
MFGSGADTGVVARTRIGYCDGRRVHQFEGEIARNIAPEPRGDRAFQWDCVFIPEGHGQTFAEMGERKSEISMRRRVPPHSGRAGRPNDTNAGSDNPCHRSLRGFG